MWVWRLVCQCALQLENCPYETMVVFLCPATGWQPVLVVWYPLPKVRFGENLWLINGHINFFVCFFWAFVFFLVLLICNVETLQYSATYLPASCMQVLPAVCGPRVALPCLPDCLITVFTVSPHSIAGNCPSRSSGGALQPKKKKMYKHCHCTIPLWLLKDEQLENDLFNFFSSSE